MLRYCIRFFVLCRKVGVGLVGAWGTLWCCVMRSSSPLPAQLHFTLYILYTVLPVKVAMWVWGRVGAIASLHLQTYLVLHHKKFFCISTWTSCFVIHCSSYYGVGWGLGWGNNIAALARLLDATTGEFRLAVPPQLHVMLISYAFTSATSKELLLHCWLL